MKTFLFALLGFAFGTACLSAADTLPPAPANHFNDFAAVVRRATATSLDRELTQFERETSNQIVVAIYPRLPADAAVEDYTVRVAQHWGVGRQDRKNGVVLFLFQASHDIRIVTGYGLEGALPDALCKRIIENEIVPRFRAGDFDAGLTAGVHALMAATKGEYKGTGRTHKSTDTGGNTVLVLFVFGLIALSLFRQAFRRHVVYGRSGRRSIWWGGGPSGGWGGGSSGGGSFSGGGGSFGGGGAGGKW